ncbi:MAG: hypothetical protein A4E53_01551 [Pelotomaculum sp. PtaB.Bin104]|nr:MAG: hypothetical protein A4E53_01551 [Pelotomaculum sp. PtaB.Bin104]
MGPETAQGYKNIKIIRKYTLQNLQERQVQIMRCLVVGADSIGTKGTYLEKKFGVKEVLHWDGRNKKMPFLPAVDLVVMLTGFINHLMMWHVKKEAKKRGIKVLYLKRGVSELEETA